jgi:ferredoxin
MEEVEIKFEPSERSGIVPVGTYLSDAAARLGVEIVDELDGEGEYEADVVQVTKGEDLLSEPTKIEIEHLTTEGRNKGQRLAAQTRIEKAGEIVVMVAKKKETEADKTEKEERDFKKEFSELPLEKKVANLLEMEMVTLSETFSFVFNSPFKIFEKGMDILAEFGLKMENDAKKAKRPGEHHTEEEAAEDKTAEKNGSKKSSRKNKTEAEAETATEEAEK